MLLGANFCRVAWTTERPRDLPQVAQDVVTAFAGPYFEAVAEWFRVLRIGACGGDLAKVIAQWLPFERFDIFLNPGQLIHLDEWVSSPIRTGSTDRIRPGMAIQVDIIPSSDGYFSTRVKDGIVMVDAVLQEQLGRRFPDCLEHFRRRPELMIDTLSIRVAEDVLPLSNTAGIVPRSCCGRTQY